MPDQTPITLRRARREDVAAILRLLADDELGAARDRVTDPPAASYLDAFARIDADPNALLAVAQDGSGAVVGALQLTFFTGLSNQGARLMLISAVRVASALRGAGVGAEMMTWAMEEGRRRGCRTAELFTHNSRVDAQRFYERLGFEATHKGMRRAL